MRTARAKGLPEFVVIGKHALRNTLIPIVTVVGPAVRQPVRRRRAGGNRLQLAGAWDAWCSNSILRRDYPTLLAILFFSAMLVMVANILTDLVYRLVDPRIRSSAS